MFTSVSAMPQGMKTHRIFVPDDADDNILIYLHNQKIISQALIR
jgi:hypothetical protein